MSIRPGTIHLSRASMLSVPARRPGTPPAVTSAMRPSRITIIAPGSGSRPVPSINVPPLTTTVPAPLGTAVGALDGRAKSVVAVRATITTAGTRERMSILPRGGEWRGEQDEFMITPALLRIMEHDDYVLRAQAQHQLVVQRNPAVRATRRSRRPLDGMSERGLLRPQRQFGVGIREAMKRNAALGHLRAVRISPPSARSLPQHVEGTSRYVNSSINAVASCTSAVSRPSVNFP